MNSLIVFLSLLSVCLSAPAEKPQIKLCKPSEPNLAKCWEKSVHDVAKVLFTGHPEYNIPPLSPLLVPKYVLVEPTFTMTLTNIQFNGMSSYELTAVEPHPSRNQATLKGASKNFKMVADVTGTGHVGGVSIEGTGKIEASFSNVTCTLELEWEAFKQDGVKYHNVFGKYIDVHYGVIKLESYDIIKDPAQVAELKKNLRDAKGDLHDDYLDLIDHGFFKHVERYLVRAYNAFSVSDD